MTVYLELVTAAETVDFAPKGRSESKESYLMRLMKAIYRIDKSLWAQLSPQAQSWYTESARKFNNRQPIEDCPGFDAAKESQLPAPENNGLTDAVRKAVLEHPHFSKAEIINVLEEEGWQAEHLTSNQTVVVVRSVTLKTIKLAKEIGRWNDRLQPALS